MEYSILKSFDQVSGYVDQICSIADQNKKSFGFLAASVYEQMASKGQLWIAINNGKELKGYLMFGGTMPTLKVSQIYVCKTVAGCGVGTQLVDSLKEHARTQNYHSISARVASDLPANTFWERMGFSIFRQVNGGKTTKRIINIRGYSLAENDLFGNQIKESRSLKPIGPMLDRPIYALDLNLLLDVFKARQGYEKVIKIMQLGFQGKFAICITPELKKELERHSASYPNDPVLRWAAIFSELNSNSDISDITESLRNAVFPSRAANRKAAQNDESDLMHLAYCIAAGVSGFISREKALLRACNVIKEQYDVLILSPDELIPDDGESLDVSTPLNSDFTLSVSALTDEIRHFLAQFSASGVITNIFDTSSPIEEKASIYEARLDGILFGIYFLQQPIKATSRALSALYIDENCPKSMAAIDHFLETSLRSKSKFPYRLDIYIGKGQDLTEETLLKKGFIKSADHFVKIICSLFLDEKNWLQFTRDVRSFCGFSMPEKLPPKKELINTGVRITDSSKRVQFFSWFDFETVIGPRFIVNADRHCILIPIREPFANGLICNVKNQLSLLPSHDKKLLLEKAYFRSSAKAIIFKKGGIIAFYVSGNKSIQEIIGFARITYSNVVSVDEATIKVGRQGVLSRKELSDVAGKSGRIHVFTFDNFLEFDRRISFARAKELNLISSANLVSPEKIDFKQLKILIGEAFDE